MWHGRHIQEGVSVHQGQVWVAEKCWSLLWAKESSDQEGSRDRYLDKQSMKESMIVYGNLENVTF